jgi:hypothetical protein
MRAAVCGIYAPESVTEAVKVAGAAVGVVGVPEIRPVESIDKPGGREPAVIDQV